MSLTRRDLMLLPAAMLAARTFAADNAVITKRAKAVVFDGLAILDPRPVEVEARRLFADTASALMNAWRIRQFEYQWLRALSNQYADFWHITEDSLTYAANAVGVHITSDARSRLMAMFARLKLWPDCAEGLTRLSAAGYRLGILSNMTMPMLASGLKSSDVGSIFEHVLSTDKIRTYKPSPTAYHMARESFGLPAQHILFVPFAGWDLAGATWFGYPTFWLNRLGSPHEELGITSPMGRNMNDLGMFLHADA